MMENKSDWGTNLIKILPGSTLQFRERDSKEIKIVRVLEPFIVNSALTIDIKVEPVEITE